MKKLNPSHFIYGELGVTNADFFNVDLSNDNCRFLNPYEIERLNLAVAKRATAVAIDFFETIRWEITSGRLLQAHNLFCGYLTEPKETCLGYSQYGVAGRGIGELAEYILGEICKDDAFLCKTMRRIEDIKLFIPQISNDRVSDLYTNVIRKVLIDYTREQCELHNIPLREKVTAMYWDDVSHSWVKTVEKQYICPVDNQPKLLIPKAFIKRDTYNLGKMNRRVIIPDYMEKELRMPESSIVYQTKAGDKKVSKKDMRAEIKRRGIILDKSHAVEFAKEHPDCVDALRKSMDEWAQKKKK